MSGSDVVSKIVFLIMGLFGISVQFKQLNILLLLGSIGISSIILNDLFSIYNINKRKNKGVKTE